jgi:hypothetical protein
MNEREKGEHFVKYLNKVIFVKRGREGFGSLHLMKKRGV